MIDEIANENGFDPSLIKKKKKKKEFDLDAAPGLNDDSKQNTVKNGETSNKPHKSVHFENIEGKKKKKKKPYNFDEMNEALSKDEVCPVANEVPAEPEDDINLDMDFLMTKKKKKNKKKEIDDLIADKKGGTDKFDKDNADEENSLWHNTDREYTYEELLERAFKIMREKNPELTSGRKPKFVVRPPQVLRVGTKKTSFANFMDIARTLHRMPKHLLGFLLAELGTSGSMDGNQQLIIKGRFQAKEIENVLRRYIKEYVTCHTCRSPETILQKDTRLFFLQCESCGSRCSKH